LLAARLEQPAGPPVVLPPDSPAQIAPQPEAPATAASHLDPLTGVLVLRELGPALQKFLANYRKDGLPVSFLYIDVDALESYNNHYGRAAGDTILKGLCRVLERSTRAGDLIGRLEGEEFIVAMNCKPADAVQAAQRLANLVKREQFDFGQNKLRITVSIGVAGYPDHGAIARLLYERAEMALYDAKTRGRNTVSTYAPNMSLPRSRTSRKASAEAY
jgi:diguanylate cyclase (GGDEF)-like protein